MAKELFLRIEQQQPAGQSAQHRCRSQVIQALDLSLDIFELRQGGAQVAGEQPHRVGHVGADGGNAHGREGWESDQRAATGKSVDGAGCQGCQGNKDEINGGQGIQLQRLLGGMGRL